MRLRRFRREALVSLARHPYWWPQFTFQAPDRHSFLWTCYWRGPYGGRHTNHGFTRRGAQRAALTEMAYWTRDQVYSGRGREFAIQTTRPGGGCWE